MYERIMFWKVIRMICHVRYRFWILRENDLRRGRIYGCLDESRGLSQLRSVDQRIECLNQLRFLLAWSDL